MPIRRAQLAYLHDLVIAGLSLGAAMFLRLGDGLTDPVYWDGLLYGTPIFIAVCAITFRAISLYRGVWRYASVPDLITITKAATLAVLIFVAVMAVYDRLASIPRSVPAIQWLVLMFLLGGPRMAYRLLKDRHLSRKAELANARRVPVLLVGAGDAAELFIRATANDRAAPYRPVGILDDRERRVGQAIHGVPVLGPPEQLTDVLRSLALQGLHPQRLVVTDPALAGDGAGVGALIERAETAGMTVSRLPGLIELKDAVDDGRVELRPIALEDLLGRRQTRLDAAAIAGLIAGRRVLVTGAGGSIGSELVRQIAALRPAELILADSGEFNLYAIDLDLAEHAPAVPRRAVICDVRDRERLTRVFAEGRPELVFHAAALKHVPLVEANPAEGVLTNAIGTRNVADAARAAGVLACVQISTDKAVNPSSVMGASKRLAEFYCQALDLSGAAPGPAASGRATRFLTVRFGNVLGSSGSVVPLFQRQLARGGPLTVTHPDIRRYFMTVREAVGLVLHASAYGLNRPSERGRILVLDMGEPIRIADIARQVIRLSGVRPDIDVRIAYTGLRPGEKLHEELFDTSEVPVATGADGVLAAAPRPIDLAVQQRALDELAAAARRGDVAELRRLIAHFVPGFIADASAAAAPAMAVSPSLAPAERTPGR